MTQLITLASGSSGNCALVSCGDTRVLIDAGISNRRICAGLAALGLTTADIGGVFITHEHSDHVSGLPMLVKRGAMPVFAPRTVASRLRGMYPELEDALNVIHTPGPVELPGLSVTAFHTLHDTQESVGYRFDSPEGSVGVCTDLGAVTEEVRSALRGVDAALIEANHDEELLRFGAYPVYLKRRILSDHGHLSNERCGELAVFLAENGAEQLILGHLSRENNRPETAYAAVRAALDAAGAEAGLLVAPPSEMLRLEVRSKCSV